LRIAQNISAYIAHRHLKNITLDFHRNIEKISTGYRVNNPREDACGLAMSERIRMQIRGLHQAKFNIQDAASMVQVAESSLIEVSNMLQRMRKLCVQSANSTLSISDRRMIQKEVNQLIEEIDRISSTTVFNAQKLIAEDGSFDVGSVVHIGANQGDVFCIRLPQRDFSDGSYRYISSQTLGKYDFKLSDLKNPAFDPQRGIMSETLSERAIPVFDTAIDQISVCRADLGAFYNRLYWALEYAGVAHEAHVWSDARIRDLDVAYESTQLAKNRIISQASSSMVAQANLLPSFVLGLLR
jgi:flagellin